MYVIANRVKCAVAMLSKASALREASRSPSNQDAYHKNVVPRLTHITRIDNFNG